MGDSCGSCQETEPCALHVAARVGVVRTFKQACKGGGDADAAWQEKGDVGMPVDFRDEFTETKSNSVKKDGGFKEAHEDEGTPVGAPAEELAVGDDEGGGGAHE